MRDPAVVDAQGVSRSLAALIAAADALAAELPPARPGSLAAFAFENDHAAFLVALWASWLRGHTVALPVDARRQAVGPTMMLPEVAVFLHDTGAGTGIRVHERNWPRAGAESVRDDIPWGPLQHCVPTADGRLIRTAVPVAELRRLSAAAAAAMPLPDGATLVVTYAAGHLPALAPGLLLPLQHGATVVSATAVGTAVLVAVLERARATDLLAPPDLLRQLARLPRGACARLARAHSLQAVDRATVERLQREHGVTVHELVPRDPAMAARQRLVESLLAVPGVDDAAVVQRSVGDVLHTFALLGCRDHDAAAVRAAAAQALGPGPGGIAVVDRVPRDRDGAIADAEVLYACGVRGDGAPPNRAVVWSDERRVAATWTARASVPIDFAGFEGHFVGHPVLSGSVQLHDVVLPALARALGGPVVVGEFADLKFLARIGPGDTLDVSVEMAADRGSASFVLARGSTRCTTGRASWRVGEGAR